MRIKDGKEYRIFEDKNGNLHLYMDDKKAIYRLEEKMKNRKSTYSNVLNRFSEFLERVYPKREIGRTELERDIFNLTENKRLI